MSESIRQVLNELLLESIPDIMSKLSKDWPDVYSWFMKKGDKDGTYDKAVEEVRKFIKRKYGKDVPRDSVFNIVNRMPHKGY